MKKDLSFKQKITSIIIAGLVMILGIIFFKYFPMEIFGKDILFDASGHLTIAIFVLYILWYFVDQNKSWRVPYFIFAGAVIVIISVQRIMANAHNDFGLITALIISFIAIFVSRWRYFGEKLDF